MFASGIYYCCLSILGATAALAQSCPPENPSGPNFQSGPLTLHGVAVFHNGLRRWMELKPDQAECGSTSIQLLRGSGGGFEVDEGSSLSLEALRGCHVVATGRLGIPGTGYYSAPLYLGVERIEADAGCSRKPAIPTYWYAHPPSSVKRYHVTMLVNYKGEGSVRATIRSGTRVLTPWQAYANYWLTGGFIFYAHCGKKFHLSDMRGTQAAKPWVMDDEITMDPETAAQQGVWSSRFDYECRR